MSILSRLTSTILTLSPFVLSLLLLSCGSSITSINGHIRNHRETPYLENIVVGKLHDNTIAIISDDVNETSEHYLHHYNDTLGIIWSTRIPVYRDAPIKPLWIADGHQGITMVFIRYENDDTITFTGAVFDRATGKEIQTTPLKGFNLDVPRRSTIRPPVLLASPDSSKFIIFQVDETEVITESGNESISVGADIFDVNLNSIASNTLRTVMDRDVEGPANETTKLHEIAIGNDGRVYQITGHGPSTLQVLQWDVVNRTQRSLRWTIPGDDLHSNDLEIGKIRFRVEQPGIVYVAAPLMTNSSMSDTELSAATLASFDFNRNAIDFSQRFNLTEELIEKLTDDEEDELEFYGLTDLLRDPASGTIILPFEHARTDILAVPGQGIVGRVPKNEHLLVLGFDKAGNPVWQTFFPMAELQPAAIAYVGQWWKIDPQEAHFIYKDGDEDALMVGRFSTATGARLPSISLLTTDLFPWRQYASWLTGNNAVILLGLGSDAHLVRISY
jgi:hypothetical protein